MNSAAIRAAFGFRPARIARRWRREIDEGLKPYGLTEATFEPVDADDLPVPLGRARIVATVGSDSL